jgi:hypothetical protein
MLHNNQTLEQIQTTMDKIAQAPYMYLYFDEKCWILTLNSNSSNALPWQESDDTKSMTTD